MKRIALFLLFMGLGSTVLHFLDMEFKLLMWIGTWGETMAWVIRAGLTLAGAGLLVLATRISEPSATD